MEESMQIGAYQLLSPFEMKDGGNCEWTFANKDGKTYFIKKISDPVYPLCLRKIEKENKKFVKISKNDPNGYFRQFEMPAREIPLPPLISLSMMEDFTS